VIPAIPPFQSKAMSSPSNLVFCDEPACGRPFQVNRYAPSLSFKTPAGVIVCPHCGRNYSADQDTLYHTHAFSMQVEAFLIERRTRRAG
jgi:hypothetical protein